MDILSKLSCGIIKPLSIDERIIKLKEEFTQKEEELENEKQARISLENQINTLKANLRIPPGFLDLASWSAQN